jgi:hypothetical protein
MMILAGVLFIVGGIVYFALSYDGFIGTAFAIIVGILLIMSAFPTQDQNNQKVQDNIVTAAQETYNVEFVVTTPTIDDVKKAKDGGIVGPFVIRNIDDGEYAECYIIKDGNKEDMYKLLVINDDGEYKELTQVTKTTDTANTNTTADTDTVETTDTNTADTDTDTDAADTIAETA